MAVTINAKPRTVDDSRRLLKMIVFLLLFLFCCLFFLWKKKHSERLPPAYPGRLPIFGHSFKMFSILLRGAIWEEYKSLAYFSIHHNGATYVDIGPKRLYFITDPEDCLTISDLCLSKPYIYNFLEPCGKTGILYSDPPKWNTDRNMYISLVNPRNITMNWLNKQCTQLVNNLAGRVGKEKAEIEPDFRTFTLETVLELVIGLESEEMAAANAEFNTVMHEILNMMIARTMNPLLHIPFIYNLSNFKIRHLKYADMANSNIRRRIEDRQKFLKRNGGDTPEHDYQPILDRLLKINEKEQRYTIEELVDHIETIVVGAFDSTAKALTIALLCIGSYPTAQERIYAELHQVLGDMNREIVKEDLSELIYLDAVIKESIRLYPVVPLVGRTASKEVKLRNYTIPKGGIHILSIYGMNHHPVWGADAEQFRPERWLEPNGVPEGAFAAFSFGKRNCIGKAFAMMSMKTALAHILRRYKVKADVKNVAFDVNMFLVPKSGAEVEIELRQADLVN